MKSSVTANLSLPLADFYSEHSEQVSDPTFGDNVLLIHNPIDLVAAASFLKNHVANQGASVVYRGQSRLFMSLRPTLFRCINCWPGSKQAADEARVLRDRHGSIVNSLGTHLSDFSNRQYSLEATLQHYGVHSTWLDAVDNLWVALWFACYNCISDPAGQYLRFVKRVYRAEAQRQNGIEPMAYILFLKTASNAREGEPGHFLDSECELVDLRVATPKEYLRPHAQHAVVVRPSSSGTNSADCYAQLILGIAAIRLEDALEWLGAGDLLSISTLFPAPIYDKGYQKLLTLERCHFKDAGAVTHICP